MAAEFPTSIPTDHNSTGSETLAQAASGLGHAALHNDHSDEIVAIATKLGTGSSTPSSGTVLRGTGAGTSAWGDVVLTTDVTGTLPVANGGTGAVSHTSGNVLVGAGTSPVTSSKAAPTGDFVGTSDSQTLSNKTLTTPTIGSFANAQHNHENAAGGGQLDGDAIAADSIDPNHLVSGTGTTWVWQAWTPSYSGITVGSGTVVARFTQTGKTVHAYWKLTVAADTSIASGCTVSLPVTASSNYQQFDSIQGVQSVNDGGAVVHAGVPLFNSTSAVVFAWYAATTTLNTTFPITEAAGDIVILNVTYEAA